MPDPRIEPQPTPLTTQPRSRPLRAHSYNLPPTGPLRGRHRRHFARQEGTGVLFLMLIASVGVYLLGVGFGWWETVFG